MIGKEGGGGKVTAKSQSECGMNSKVCRGGGGEESQFALSICVPVINGQSRPFL